MLRHALQMPIALVRSALCRITRHASRSWRDNHFRIRIALGDSVVDASLIVGSVANEGGKRSRDLVEQGLDLRSIIDIAGGQL